MTGHTKGIIQGGAHSGLDRRTKQARNDFAEKIWYFDTCQEFEQNLTTRSTSSHVTSHGTRTNSPDRCKWTTYNHKCNFIRYDMNQGWGLNLRCLSSWCPPKTRWPNYLRSETYIKRLLCWVKNKNHRRRVKFVWKASCTWMAETIGHVFHPEYCNLCLRGEGNCRHWLTTLQVTNRMNLLVPKHHVRCKFAIIFTRRCCKSTWIHIALWKT